MFKINDDMVIPRSEIEFRFARSRGPGGQNVNKVNSKATLRWNLRDSSVVSDAVRKRLETRAANRINEEGWLVLSCEVHRQQSRNVSECLEKLRSLINDALRPVRKRISTRPTRASRERRLRDKRTLSHKKQSRRQPGRDD